MEIVAQDRGEGVAIKCPGCRAPATKYPNGDIYCSDADRTYTPTQMFVAINGRPAGQSAGEALRESIAEPEQPATLAELLHRIAYGAEILPHPIAVEFRDAGQMRKIQVSSATDFEQWRSWLGAEVGDTPQWSPQGGVNAMQRRHQAIAQWRGHSIELVRVEFRWTPETRAERRQRLADELANLDNEIANGGVS